jgi:protein-L-isoaspartate(D-aspartate) O-methyltransferase
MTDFIQARQVMVRQQLLARGIANKQVLTAMGKVPRENFVPVEYRDHAYDDSALPLIEGQTISQPYMVAKMLELLDVRGTGRYLEVGTGSGYAAAVLSECVAEVHTVDILPDLIALAKINLEKSGYTKLQLHVGDGTLGWPDAAPFDGIIVMAGAVGIPETLPAQLAEGGTLVMPIGNRFLQRLTIVKKENEDYVKSLDDACVFVPLQGGWGWKASFPEQ